MFHIVVKLLHAADAVSYISDEILFTIPVDFKDIEDATSFGNKFIVTNEHLFVIVDIYRHNEILLTRTSGVDEWL